MLNFIPFVKKEKFNSNQKLSYKKQNFELSSKAPDMKMAQAKIPNANYQMEP